MNARTWFWLVRRELWEHRGSLVVTPVFVAGLFLLLTLAAWGLGEIHLGQLSHASDLGERHHLFHLVAAAHAQELNQALDLLLVAPCVLVSLIMGMVIFAYALGSLYNERRDRSVLFWKSLPISNTAVVGSKALVALVVVPLYALAMGLLAGALSVSMVMGSLAFHGWPIDGLSMEHALTTVGSLLAVWPLSLLLALPTVSWLLLCSAWSRSKPFIWAIVVPVGLTLMLGWLRWMGWPLGFLPVGRLLLGTFPLLNLGLVSGWTQGLAESVSPLLGMTWTVVLTTPSVWVGVGVGLMALVGAIWGRQRAGLG